MWEADERVSAQLFSACSPARAAAPLARTTATEVSSERASRSQPARKDLV